MNFERLLKALLFSFMVFNLISCGAEFDDAGYISGGITVAEGCENYLQGPVFIAVSTTGDLSEIEKNPSSIAVMIEADVKKGRYKIDIEDTGLSTGDNIYLVAFSDNDYMGGIPLPSPGDIVGIFIDTVNLNLEYTIGSSEPSPDIELDRIYYDFDADAKGYINTEETGDIILIAYAGDSGSFDISSFDTSRVIGYKKILNPALPGEFSFSILPFFPPGLETPEEGFIEWVYIVAVLDKNRNGVFDDGDMIGYPVDEFGLPKSITLQEGENDWGTIIFP